MWMMPAHQTRRNTHYLVFAVALNFVLGYSLPL